MRQPAAPGARRPGRLAAALAVVVGLVVLQLLTPAAAGVRLAAAAARVTARTADSSVTVTGPVMYNSMTGKPSSAASTVTVSQTTNLVNQMVSVKWTNFTPSLVARKPAPLYNWTTTAYPVVVAECPGDTPGTAAANLSKCFGAANPGLTTPSKFGQTSEVYATTSPQGTGTANIQIETSVQNQQLGCDAKHDCSLIILSAQGGNPGSGPRSTGADCGDHTFDQGGPLGGNYALAAEAFQVPSAAFGSDFCTWQKRIVIPLHFAKTLATCGFSQPDFSVEGSPFTQRAMTSWQSGLCNQSSPISVGYNGSVSEPQARTDFQRGTADVALTTQPASGPASHPFTYAPVAISAAAVAYWLDSAKTGLPYPSGLKLTPLLLAKELTQSYTYSLACPTKPGLQHLVCDPGVVGDKTDLLSDPQFTALNPGLSPNAVTATPMVPTVEGDNSDMTWQVTSWIADSKDAASFMAGQKLPDGEHLNTFYKTTHYPVQEIQASDPKGWAFFAFQPVPTPPSQVATDQVLNSPPSLNPASPVLDQQGRAIPGAYNKVAAQQQGSRTLLAVLDEPDAANFLMPTFALQNPAGKYVTPTAASMAAAVKDMTVSRDGITRQDNPNAKDPAAYPLTMVSYAMVPTGCTSKHKAATIADWLDFVADHGQGQGTNLGQLPPGYLPLPGFMRQQTLKAANEVRHQTGQCHGGGPGGGGPGGGVGNGPGGGSTLGNGSSGTGSSGGGSGTSGGGSTTHTSSATKANAAYSSPGSSGLGRFLPILLAIGALLALAGSSAVVFGRPGSRAAVIAGWHRVQRFTLRRGK